MDKVDVKKLKQQKLKQVLQKRREDFRVVVENDNLCLYRDESKCIRCGRCKDACSSDAGVFDSFDREKSKNICIGCGKCVSACPTGALLEKSGYRQVLEALNDYDKTLVVSVAPAVRVAIAEEFGFNSGIYDEGRLISALRMIGFDYVFDVTFGADLSVMEEATELVKRLTLKNKPLPQFPSCCPAWVNYVEIYRPDLIANLSTTKSPISMQGAIIKTFFAKEKNFKPENIVHVTIAPCIAKKSEINRDNISGSAKYWKNESLKDVDYVITTRELAHMIKKLNIPYGTLPNGEFDKLFSHGSGSGIIFGNSGGVTEATLREAYYLLNGEEAPANLLTLKKLRSVDGIKEDMVDLGETKIRVAVCNGLKAAKQLLEELDKKEKEFDFIEIMTCESGCVGGPGQPKSQNPDTNQKRAAALYHNDEESKIRSAHNNPDIQNVYSKFLGMPLSKMSKMLLHTTYNDNSKKFILKENKKWN